MLKLNEVQLSGRVGGIKSNEVGDTTITNIRLAVTERYKKKDGQLNERTMWINAATSGKSAEFANKFVAIGDLIYVAGRLRDRTYNDRDGIERTVFEVWADDIQIVEKKKKAEANDDMPL